MRHSCWCGALLLFVACAGGTPSDVPDEDAGTAALDGPRRADLASANQASWNVTANFKVNGYDIQSAARSAVFVHRPPPAEQTSIILTDVPDYCAALRAKKCPVDVSHFRLEFRLKGAAAGTSSIEAGEASVYWGDVIASCTGAGIGASSGSIVVSRLEAQPGGLAAMRFDFTGPFGLSASGTINALFCDVD